MKGTKTKSGQATKPTTKTTTATSSGARNAGTASKYCPDDECVLTDWCVGKNSKEAFLKKLQICMKNYDYKDETKDVRGKVTHHIHH